MSSPWPAAARATFLRTIGGDTQVIDRLFRDIEDIFQGRYSNYLQLDMRYHDLSTPIQPPLPRFDC